MSFNAVCHLFWDPKYPSEILSLSPKDFSPMSANGPLASHLHSTWSTHRHTHPVPAGQYKSIPVPAWVYNSSLSFAGLVLLPSGIMREMTVTNYRLGVMNEKVTADLKNRHHLYGTGCIWGSVLSLRKDKGKLSSNEERQAIYVRQWSVWEMWDFKVLKCISSESTPQVLGSYTYPIRYRLFA